MSLPLMTMMGRKPAEAAIISNASHLDLDFTQAEFEDGWTDLDKGVSITTYETNAPGADPKSTVWSFNTNASAADNDKAVRRKDFASLDSVGNRIVISAGLYFDAIGINAGLDRFQFEITRSDWLTYISFCSDGLFFYTGSHVFIGDWVIQKLWQKWTFDYDLSGGVANGIVDIYLNSNLLASGVDCNFTGSYDDGRIYFSMLGYATDNQRTYINYLKIGDGFA